MRQLLPPSLRFMRAASLTLAASLGAVPPGAQAQIMAVPGKLEVTQQGAASYTIPIAVPPGTAGMTPALTLAYSSQQGDAPLGMGWALTGLPSIARCPQTMPQDGVRGGINYDANDRFCLDGQRLMAVSGTYGADGTEYRTEVEGFTKVVSKGSAGSGPAWFEARTKTGQVMEFGHTADSQMLAQGKTTARAWMVSKIADTKGNYLTATYTSDSANGLAYPARIDYTGNAAAALSPYNSIQFSYSVKPSKTPFYQAGSLQKVTQLLTGIKAYAGASLVNDYRLTYQTDSSKRSQLIGVKQCAGDGSCLPETALGVNDPGSSSWSTFTMKVNDTGVFSKTWTPITGDFNGDGKTDYAMVAGGNTMQHVYLSKGDGTFTWLQNDIGGAFPSSYWTPIVGDFNGDGKTDYAMVAGGNTMQHVFLSKGDGTFTWQKVDFGGGFPSNYWTPIVGDFNGDGRTDYALVAGGNTMQHVFLSKGDGTFTWQKVDFGGAFPPGTWTPITGDFNGDGKTDYAMVAGGNTMQHVFLSKGDGTFTWLKNDTGGAFPSNYWTPIVGDFNGDGNTDYGLIAGGNTMQHIFLSKGDGTFIWQKNDIGLAFGVKTWVPIGGDFNGDGKADYMMIAGGNSYQHVFIGNGDGTFSYFRSDSGINLAASSWNALSGDFRGRGKSDYAMVTGGNTKQYIFLNNAGEGGLLTKVTTGLGATTEITYDRLTNPAIYTKGSSSVYPIQDIQAPFPAVSLVDASNGIGGRYKTAYSYAGAKADLSGRGFLGFATMTATDLQTNIIETTAYNQAYPLLGLPSNKTRTLNNSVLGLDTTTYTATTLGGTRYFVAPSQVVSASTDLSGTALPAITTTTQYDGYGNPTVVRVSTPDGASRTTTSTYTNDAANWRLGRLTSASVTSVVP